VNKTAQFERIHCTVSHTASNYFTILCHSVTLTRDKPGCQLKSLDLGQSPKKGRRPRPKHSSFRNLAAGVTVFQRCSLMRISVSEINCLWYILHCIGQTLQQLSM